LDISFLTLKKNGNSMPSLDSPAYCRKSSIVRRTVETSKGTPCNSISWDSAFSRYGSDWKRA